MVHDHLTEQTKGGMDTKPHAVTDNSERPVHFFITTGQVSDYTNTAAFTDRLPEADWLLVYGEYDADCCREIFT